MANNMNMGWATTVSCVSGINSSLLSSNSYKGKRNKTMKIRIETMTPATRQLQKINNIITTSMCGFGF